MGFAHAERLCGEERASTARRLMKALVIGASGHLGAHLVRVLQKEGQRVRAFVRPTSDLRGLQGIDMEIARGSLAEPATLAAAVRGCDEVYHLAAPTDRQPDAQTSIVDGTRNVLEACRNGRCGAPRLHKLDRHGWILVESGRHPRRSDESANRRD